VENEDEGIVIGVARSEECSEFGSLADNFLLFEHRQKSPRIKEGNGKSLPIHFYENDKI